LKPLNVTIVARFATAKDCAMEGPNTFLKGTTSAAFREAGWETNTCSANATEGVPYSTFVDAR
jgi:hypothetical protein